MKNKKFHIRMQKISSKKGITTIELLVVASIIIVMATVALPNLMVYIKQYRYDNYVAKMEYLVKYSKMLGMERTTNISVCVSGSSVTLYDIGNSRSAAICSGTAVPQQGLSISESYISLSGSGASFDPRGMAIQTGYVCLAYNNGYTRLCISSTGVRKEIGSGDCASCSS
ncbi:MAG: type II secretion system protein [Nitrospirae bacterium]|nr:type II secretion system protein [Nitrospirota bacterium]